MAKGKTIKGLTVEIGGDTTKLGKALEDVNKKSRDLTGELNEVNRLLKLNPGNTELLAQKQKLLAEAVDTTADKLKTLKEAEKQVQKQFERGEVSEEQVRALKREIVATEGKLKHYQSEAERATKETKEFGDEAEQTSNDVDGFGEKLGQVASKGFAAVAAAATAATAALVASAEASREYRGEMGKLDAAFSAQGHSAESAHAAYKELQGIIGETDQSVEAAQQISLLASSEEEVARWAHQAAGVVGQFGDALQPETFFEAANETIKLGEATGAYTQMLEGTGMNVDEFNAGLAACNTEAEKQAYMLEVTEKALGAAGDKYREINADVILANEANEAWAASMAEVGGVIDPLLSDVKLLGASILSEFVPGIKAAADGLRGMLNGEDGAAEALGETISGMFGQLVEKITEMLPTVAQMASDLVLTIIQSLLGTISTEGPALLGAVIEGVNFIITELGAMLPQLVPLAIEAVLTLAETLLDNIDSTVDAGTALLEGLADGILAALPILIERAPVIIGKLVGAINKLLPKLFEQGTSLLIQLSVGLTKAIPQLVGSIPAVIKAVLSAFKSLPGDMLNVGKNLIKGLWEGISDMTDWIVGKLDGFGDTVLSGIKNFFGIKSPSRVFKNEIGKMLALGLAEGIEDNADKPLDALAGLSSDLMGEADLLNGLTLERRIQHAFAPTEQAGFMTGLSGKLDQIYQAILKGQVIMLDGKTLVGSTVNRYDGELGLRRNLAERGAL